MAELLEFLWDDEDVRKALPQRAGLMAANLHDALRVAAMKHQNALERLHRVPPPRSGLIPVKTASSALSSFGTLLGDTSSGYTITPAKSASPGALKYLELRRYIGRGLSYGPTQEFGATIAPRSAKVLTIPTKFWRTQAGVSRGSIRNASGHWRKTKANALYFFEDGTGLPLAKGVGPGLDQTEVTIPPRLRFFATWDKLQPERDKALHRAVQKALDGRTTRGTFNA